MARILRLLSDPTCAHEPGSVDPPKTTFLSLAAVAERAQPFQRTAPSWRAKVQCSGRRRFTDGILAYVRTPGGPTGPAQPLFRRTQAAPPLCRCSSLTQSNRRGTDPYARWCGRGGIARCPPIPISCPIPAVRNSRGDRLSWVENRPSLGRCFSIRGSWQLAQLCFQESEVDGLGEEIG